VTRIGELGKTQAATSNRRTLVFLRSVRRLLVAACVVPSSPIFVTLMKEAQVPLKRRFLQEPHGVTTQKTPFLIETLFHNLRGGTREKLDILQNSVHSH
jgi:hypothetical protein